MVKNAMFCPFAAGYCGVCRSELHWQYHQVFAMLIIPATIPFFIMITLYCLMARTYSKHVSSPRASHIGFLLGRLLGIHGQVYPQGLENEPFLGDLLWEIKPVITEISSH